MKKLALVLGLVVVGLSSCSKDINENIEPQYNVTDTIVTVVTEETDVTGRWESLSGKHGLDSLSLDFDIGLYHQITDHGWYVRSYSTVFEVIDHNTLKINLSSGKFIWGTDDNEFAYSSTGNNVGDIFTVYGRITEARFIKVKTLEN